MPFSGMIKLKLEFLKSKQNKISKITKKYQFYFTFILEYFLKKKTDYMTQEEERRKEKERETEGQEERKRRKKKKEKIKKIKK